MMSHTANLFGLSGGKDSTYLLGWAIHESGYPKESLWFTFSDTENEYDEVYQQIRDLDAYLIRYGCRPIETLRASGDWVEKFKDEPLFLALAMHKKRFPSAKTRFCTEELKIKPTKQFIKKLLSEGYEVVSHSGVRGGESFERSLMEEWGTDLLGCKTRRPLLKLQLSDIWDGHKKWGLPINKLYLQGWKRVGCRLCVMSRKSDVRQAATKRPWVIDLYEDWEKKVGDMRQIMRIPCHFSSLFHRNTVPERFRSIQVETNQGPMKVCSIRDVAFWSLTGKGAKLQNPLQQELNFDVEDSHEPCKSGYCE
jgi:3'-phosphoadenosine 5'-phosphosulfate sulfotransferase (PAPS reductase)/FAD synthetase